MNQQKKQKIGFCYLAFGKSVLHTLGSIEPRVQCNNYFRGVIV